MTAASLPLVISLGPRMITTSWYRGTEQMAPVVDIPTHVNLFEYNPDWSGTGITTVRSTSNLAVVIDQRNVGCHVVR